MVKHAQKGFTLVETSIVLAITAGLLVAILTGQAGVRDSARFKQSVELAVSTLDRARSSAVNVTNSDPAATGTDTTQIIFGKLVEINPVSSTMTIYDLIGTNSDQINSSQGQILSKNTVSKSVVVLPWGVTNLRVAKIQLVFHRLSDTGLLQIYRVPSNIDPLTYSYSENPGLGAIVNIDLTDHKGRTATVTVDGEHGGAVSRVYQ